MHTETLVYFQYTNAATSCYVSATEYRHSDGSISFRVATNNGKVNSAMKVVSPVTRAEAVRLAEEAIADFVKEMAAVYLA